MNFWDRLVIRCCLGLGEGYHPGFDLARPLLASLYQRRLLQPAALNPIAQVLLLLVCPPGSALHQATFAVYQGQPLNENQLWDAIRATLRPRFADFHALGSQGQPRQAALVATAYRMMVVPDLTRFFSRLRLIDEARARLLIQGVFPRIYRAAQSSLPDGTGSLTIQDEVEVELYSTLLGPSPWSAQNSPPTTPLDWAATLEPEETHFLAMCRQHLASADRRALLYLCFYGQLSLHTLTRVVRRATQPSAPVSGVALDLAYAWEAVVDRL